MIPAAVLGFLNLGLLASQDWDATLLFVMGGGVIVSFLSYQFVEQYKVVKNFRPLSKPMALTPGSEFRVPQTQVIDAKLLVGAGCFGVGWGITGLCPGPAMFLASSVGVSWVLIGYWPTFLVGSFLAARFHPCKPCEQDSDDDDDHHKAGSLGHFAEPTEVIVLEDKD